MELKHLRYFIALADDPDVAKTAKHCGLSSSVMMKHIADLEESLGCSLFRRHNSSVTLSAAGQVFYQRAKDLLASAAAAAGEVRAAAAAMASQLRIGHTGQWSILRYASAFKRFSVDYPGVRLHPVEFSPADLPGALRRGEIDMALIEHVDVGMRIEFKVRRVESFTGQVAFPAEHPLAGKSKVSLRELEEEVWIGWDERIYPGRQHLLLDAAKTLGFVPCIAHDAESDFMMYDVVSGGTAIGFIGHPPAEEMPRGVVLVPLHPATIEFPLFMAWRKDAENLDQLESLAGSMLASVSAKHGHG